MKLWRAFSFILLIIVTTFSYAQVSALNKAPTVFDDVPPSFYANEAINIAVNAGIIVGRTDGTFDGYANLTRYESAIIIARLLTKYQNDLRIVYQDIQGLDDALVGLAEDYYDMRDEVDNLRAAMDNQANDFEVASLRDQLNAMQGRLGTLERQIITQAGIAGRPGPQGLQGPAGPVGPQGPAGSPGATGAAGSPGTPGPAGATGSTGATGATGSPGPATPGVQGPQGPQGPSGPAGPATPGVQGPQGPQGPAGPQGPQGPVAGSSTAGPQGPSGPAGPQGPAGPAGPQGPTGPAGPASTTPAPALANYTPSQIIIEPVQNATASSVIPVDYSTSGGQLHISTTQQGSGAELHINTVGNIYAPLQVNQPVSPTPVTVYSTVVTQQPIGAAAVVTPQPQPVTIISVPSQPPLQQIQPITVVNPPSLPDYCAFAEYRWRTECGGNGVQPLPVTPVVTRPAYCAFAQNTWRIECGGNGVEPLPVLPEATRPAYCSFAQNIWRTECGGNGIEPTTVLTGTTVSQTPTQPNYCTDSRYSYLIECGGNGTAVNSGIAPTPQQPAYCTTASNTWRTECGGNGIDPSQTTQSQPAYCTSATNTWRTECGGSGTAPPPTPPVTYQYPYPDTPPVYNTQVTGTPVTRTPLPQNQLPYPSAYPYPEGGPSKPNPVSVTVTPTGTSGVSSGRAAQPNYDIRVDQRPLQSPYSLNAAPQSLPSNQQRNSVPTSNNTDGTGTYVGASVNSEAAALTNGTSDRFSGKVVLGDDNSLAENLGTRVDLNYARNTSVDKGTLGISGKVIANQPVTDQVSAYAGAGVGYQAQGLGHTDDVQGTYLSSVLGVDYDVSNNASLYTEAGLDYYLNPSDPNAVSDGYDYQQTYPTIGAGVKLNF